MRVGVTGATGLIGEALCRSLVGDGHSVRVFARDPAKAGRRLPETEAIQWDASDTPSAEAVRGLDAVVNLAGEPIAEGRWSSARKKAIADSRVLGTRNIVEAIAATGSKGPKILINGSAVGFYGSRGDEELNEDSSSGGGFLAEVCRNWEAEALKAVDKGVRVVLLRTGIVLSPKGGALAKMLPAFKMFAGGPLGDGKQWMSWIHLDDQVSLIRHALDCPDCQGPFNATAPNPATNKDFSKTLGRVLGRPALLPAPGFALKLLMGEMAGPLLLEGQRVLPKRALESGFEFQFPQLEEALRHLVG